MEHNELIELYVRGKLGSSEKAGFEKRIKNDAELAAEVQIQKDIYEALKEKDVVEFHQNLQNIYSKLEHESPEVLGKVSGRAASRMFITKWYYRAAAAAAILLMAGSILYFTLRPPKYERLFAAYYKHIDAGTIERSVMQVSNDAFTRALDAYNAAGYDIALENFKAVNDTSINKPAAFFLGGISAIELDKTDEAILMLQKVKPSSLYNEASQWYLALCYLRKNNPALAKPLLDKLSKGDGNYNVKAGELLKELE